MLSICMLAVLGRYARFERIFQEYALNGILQFQQTRNQTAIKMDSSHLISSRPFNQTPAKFSIYQWSLPFSCFPPFN